MKTLTNEQLELLKKPLPAEAISKHPTKTYLSSIKAIYVTERMNDVFGIGQWHTKVKEQSVSSNGMVVVHVTFEVPDYGIYYESFGGNDNGGETNKNFDLGDAYKGATTDAITKIGSFLGIGIDVFKGKANTDSIPEQPKKEWLNKGTKAWTNAVEKLSTGEITIEEIKKYYSLNKANEAELLTFKK